jgi:purine-nucleoside phosphorylase
MMDEFITISEIDETKEFIRDRIKIQPRIAVILGSGLGELADSVSDPDSLNYSELPYWPVSTVVGHQGRLIAGTQEGHDVIVLQGRSHYYEGYSISRLGFPVRVLQRLGVEILVITNAAGAVNPGFEPGELMLIKDHLNLLGMTGANPLRGPNLEEFGPRFPDMSQAYDRELMNLARQSAREAKIKLYEGVYVALAGPSFETPADLRFLHSAGADAVGMSTVPEVITARHGGLKVLGISGISNKANLDGNTITTHEEVLEAGKQITPKLVEVIRGVFRLI